LSINHVFISFWAAVQIYDLSYIHL